MGGEGAVNLACSTTVGRKEGDVLFCYGIDCRCRGLLENRHFKVTFALLLYSSYLLAYYTTINSLVGICSWVGGGRSSSSELTMRGFESPRHASLMVRLTKGSKVLLR